MLDNQRKRYMACGGGRKCGGSDRKSNPTKVGRMGKKITTKNTIKSITRKTKRG